MPIGGLFTPAFSDQLPTSFAVEVFEARINRKASALLAIENDAWRDFFCRKHFRHSLGLPTMSMFREILSLNTGECID